MTFAFLTRLLLEEAPKTENLLPIDEYIEYARTHDELVIEDPDYDYIVVAPKTISSSCYYVQGKTKISFCTADPTDPTSFENVRRYGLTLYYILSKNISIKNRNSRSIFAVIASQHMPPDIGVDTFARMYATQTKQQMIDSRVKKNPDMSYAEAEQSVNSQFHYTNPDGSFTDSFLDWVEDSLNYVKENGALIQIFDSKNKLVSVSNFKKAIEVPFKLGGESRNTGLFQKFKSILGH